MTGGKEGAPCGQEGADNYLLRLYVAGTSPKSIRAVENLKRICDMHLQGRYELEVVDIYQEGTDPGSPGIVAAPMLVRELPLPVQRLSGDLSDSGKLLALLGLSREQS